MDENAAAYLAQVPGIDAILAGHSHLVFPDPSFANLPGVDVARGTINGVPTVMAGFWGSHLGVVDLTLRRTAEGWRRVDGIAAARGIRRRENNQWVAAVDSDPAIVAAVQTEHTGTLAYVRRPVVRSTARIHSYFALVQDDPSVQLVARAQAAYIRRVLQGGPHANLPVLSAAAPFKAGGRGGPAYYTDVPAGDIAIRNVADLYLYPNTVRAVRVSGAIVREWLEMSAGQFNRIDPAVTTPQLLINPAFPTYNYDVIDGVTYRIDVTQPARYTPQGRIADAQARRIVDLTFRGQPVTDAMEFVVATNNYRASGGGNFPGMEGLEDRLRDRRDQPGDHQRLAGRPEDGGRDSDADLVLRAHRGAGPGGVRVLARGEEPHRRRHAHPPRWRREEWLRSLRADATLTRDVPDHSRPTARSSRASPIR